MRCSTEEAVEIRRLVQDLDVAAIGQPPADEGQDTSRMAFKVRMRSRNTVSTPSNDTYTTKQSPDCIKHPPTLEDKHD